MNDIIFQKIGANIILHLKNKRNSNLSEIGRELGASYAHLFNVVKELENIGIIQSTKKGREKKVKLTTKGRRVAELISEIKDIIKNDKEQFDFPEKSKQKYSRVIDRRRYLTLKKKSVLIKRKSLKIPRYL